MEPHIQYSSNINIRQFNGYRVYHLLAHFINWAPGSSTVASKPEARLIIIRLEGQRASDRIICDSTKSVTFVYRKLRCFFFFFSWNTHRNCWFEYRQCPAEISYLQKSALDGNSGINSFSFPSLHLVDVLFVIISISLWECGRQCNLSIN